MNIATGKPRLLPYSRLKLFLPVSALFFVLGLINYLHTYIDTGRLIAPEDA
jgi:hypothetical protein